MKPVLSFLLGLCFLYAAGTCNAAIVYTDFGQEGYSPELTTKGGAWGSYWYNTTIGDCILELPSEPDTVYSLRYRLEESSTASNDTTVVFLIGPRMMGGVSTTDVSKLDKGVLVGPDAHWNGSSNDPRTEGRLYDKDSSGVAGNWADMAEGQTAYLGFSFDNKGLACFGWAELYIARDDGLISVYGYAWDDTGSPILTGDTGNPVPVPGTLLLLGCGLAGLAGLGRKKTKTYKIFNPSTFEPRRK